MEQPNYVSMGSGQTADGAQHIVHTVPARRRAMLRSAQLTNTTGGTLTVTVWHAPAGTTVGAGAVMLLDALSLATTVSSNQEWNDIVLNSGDQIIIQSSAAGIAYDFGGIGEQY